MPQRHSRSNYGGDRWCCCGAETNTREQESRNDVPATGTITYVSAGSVADRLGSARRNPVIPKDPLVPVGVWRGNAVTATLRNAVTAHQLRWGKRSFGLKTE